MKILTLNSGSSSIKFSVFTGDGEMGCMLDGELAGIGGDAATLRVSESKNVAASTRMSVEATTLEQAIRAVLDAVSRSARFTVDAVGYRMVHPGPKLRGNQRVTPELLKELERAVTFAPLHGPEALLLIRETMRLFPRVPHFVCFDTVFHETMPESAKTYALPEETRSAGVHRYGFHGLSCESVVRQMRARGVLPKRIVIAHLGSGCSLTATVDGASVDTTMGLTPTGGIVMGTRSGDIDPGVVLYLLREQRGGREEAIDAVETVLNHNAGIVALSGMANDVRAVRAAAKSGNAEALLALKVFTRSITKAIGGYCWLLGGLDAVVFTGGIGEHDAETRAEVLAGVAGLGVVLDAELNATKADGVRRVSATDSQVEVWIVPAEEDMTIALHVDAMAGLVGHEQ